MKYFVTGGAGFIGSNLIRILLEDPTTELVINVDKLTYAGNLDNLKDVEDDPRYVFHREDVCNSGLLLVLFDKYRPDVVFHLAAETHVDNSISLPDRFFETNLRGTFSLLETIRQYGRSVKRYIHVSTDEVYGSIEAPNEASELYPLNPSSPYSAAKAGSDMLAISYFKTFGLPVIVTRASNNYGPCQFPEKLIPLMISNAMQDKPLPMYGDGMQVRDWLYVDDHCHGLVAALQKGKLGEIYNIGGTKSLPNKEVIETILRLLEKPETLIESVKDRPGHDVRYAITSDKIQADTGWQAATSFAEGMSKTIDWYKDNQQWIVNAKRNQRFALNISRTHEQ